MSKYWFITDNKPNLALWDEVKKDGEAGKNYIRGVWQLEKAPTTNRLHVQGYLVTTKKVRFEQLKKMMKMPHLHVQKARGSDAECTKYCTKEDTRHVFEDGTYYQVQFGAPQLGKAGTSEEANAFQAAKEGKSMAYIAEKYTGAFARRYKGIQAIRATLRPPRKEGDKIDGLFIFGPTGAGKTTYAHKLADRWIAEGKYNGKFMQQPKGNWFDGYDGEQIMILNEMTGDREYDISFPTLLGMFDPYKMEVPYKGGFINLHVKVFIITTNVHMDQFYICKYNQGQLARRMSLGILEMKQRKDIMIKPKEYLGVEDFEKGLERKVAHGAEKKD